MLRFSLDRQHLRPTLIQNDAARRSFYPSGSTYSHTAVRSITVAITITARVLLVLLVSLPLAIIVTMPAEAQMLSRMHARCVDTTKQQHVDGRGDRIDVPSLYHPAHPNPLYCPPHHSRSLPTPPAVPLNPTAARCGEEQHACV